MLFAEEEIEKEARETASAVFQFAREYLKDGNLEDKNPEILQALAPLLIAASKFME
jgi:hypothetical protein